MSEWIVPPPEMWRPVEVSVWSFAGPLLGLMAIASIALGLGALW
jgi:hypothetical protein